MFTLQMHTRQHFTVCFNTFCFAYIYNLHLNIQYIFVPTLITKFLETAKLTLMFIIFVWKTAFNLSESMVFEISL